MSKKDWGIRYQNQDCEKRVLISLPEEMLADAHQVAKSLGISVAELIRRGLTNYGPMMMWAEKKKEDSAGIRTPG